MSLKRELENKIRKKGELSYDELVSYCRIFGYKVGNGERRLRELCNETDIKTIRTSKGHIKGYTLGEAQGSLF